MADSPSIRNDLLKSLYIGMLQEIPSEAGTFWKQHPLHLDDKTLSESALLEHIWDDDAQTPLEYVTRVLGALEPFLVKRGVATEEFINHISYWVNRGTFLHAKFFLLILNPLVSRLFSTSDVMSFLLQFTDIIGSKLVKGLSFPILKKQTLNGKKHVYAMVRMNELLSQSLTPWDGYLFSAKLLQSTPKVFGLPAYDAVELLCDARSVDKIIWVEDFELRDGVLFISGIRIGSVMAFSEFCTLHDLNLKSNTVAPIKGVNVEKDYYCPERKRVVLRRGCFYGAPVYLFKIVYTLTIHTKKENYLEHAIEEATREDKSSLKTLEQQHLKLVELAKETVVIEYRSHEDIIFLSGKEMRRGISAKILSRILRENQKEGKTEFTFREFKYDKSLYHSPKNTGFEVGLQRLAESLKNSGYSLELKLIGSGKFCLESRVKIDFRETSLSLVSKS